MRVRKTSGGIHNGEGEKTQSVRGVGTIKVREVSIKTCKDRGMAGAEKEPHGGRVGRVRTTC